MDRFAFNLYLVFVCSWFLHLPARYPALNGLRADLVLVVVILGLCVMSRAGDEPPPEEIRMRNVLWALVGYAAVTIPLVEWPGSVVKIGFPNFFKAFVFYYFTASLITTPKRLSRLLIVFLACQIFRVMEPLYLHVTEGYWGSVASMANWEVLDRLSGSPFDIVNPNGLAAIILSIVPFLHYMTVRSFLGRLIYLATMPELVWALVLTGSRSGMIGLAGILLQVFGRSKHKVALAGITVVAVMVTLPLMSGDLADRYKSIFSSDTKNAATAGERMGGMTSNLHVALRRPLFGYGLGTSKEANANFGEMNLPAHNLYLEVAQELGFFGLVIFMTFIGTLVMGLMRASEELKRTKNPPLIVVRVVPALQVFVGVSLLFSLASYGLSMFDWYLAAGLTVSVRRLLAPAQAAAAAQQVTASHAALGLLPVPSKV